MAIDVEVQRLQLGDVILVDIADKHVEAKIVRAVERTETSIRATMRSEGHEDFILEWPLDELVTLVRGP